MQKSSKRLLTIWRILNIKWYRFAFSCCCVLLVVFFFSFNDLISVFSEYKGFNAAIFATCPYFSRYIVHTFLLCHIRELYNARFACFVVYFWFLFIIIIFVKHSFCCALGFDRSFSQIPFDWTKNRLNTVCLFMVDPSMNSLSWVLGFVITILLLITSAGLFKFLDSSKPNYLSFLSATRYIFILTCHSFISFNFICWNSIYT